MNKESNWTELLSSVDDKIDPRIFEEFGMTKRHVDPSTSWTQEKQEGYQLIDAFEKETDVPFEGLKINDLKDTIQYDGSSEMNQNKEENHKKPGILNQVVLVDDYLNSNLKKDFCWKDIPMFSVITGENGVGKSKLLNAILYGYNEKRIKISNVSLEFNEIKQEDIEILALKFDGENFIPLFHPTEETSNTNFTKKIDEKKKNLEDYCEKRLSALIKQESFTVDPSYEPQWKKKVFEEKPISHFKSIENLIFKCLDIKNQNNESFGNSLKKLNDFLSHKKLKYKIYFSKDDIKYYDGAEDFSFHKSFGFQDSSMRVDDSIGIGNLSTGERLQLLLYLWNFTKFNNKAILIFDEFDAHIHPPLIKDLVDIFQNQFVKESGIQVILTTHNPITVIFIPNDCLFVMKYSDESKKLNPTIEKVKSKKDAINLLSSNVVYVNEPYSFVMVEGYKDQKFYTEISNILLKKGKLKHRFEFQVVGTKDPKRNGSQKSDCKTVKKVLEGFYNDNKFETVIEGLERFFGIIDHDINNKSNTGNLCVLRRYSFENYKYDPLNLFLFLKENFIEKYNEFCQCFNLNDENYQGILNAFAKILNGCEYEQYDENNVESIFQEIHEKLENIKFLVIHFLIGSFN
eukprot:gene11554-4805_t